MYGRHNFILNYYRKRFYFSFARFQNLFMKALSLTALLLIILCHAWSQTNKTVFNLKGTVVDSSTGKSLAYATGVLQNQKTHTTVKNFLSGEDGSFEFSFIDSLDYAVIFAFTGYDNKTISLVRGQSTNLGSIPLKPSDKQMKEVSVVAVKPIIKRDLDGITYDVNADPESTMLSALDMMRKVPLLSVDATDNIKLRGKSNYKIFINGKESALLAKNPSDVLRSMPATNIERIEVITTPPAKYDAEGLAGIINIITKKKLDEGYNIGVNGRLNTVWGPGINLNGTYKKGKFGLSGYLGYNVRHQQTNGIGGEQNFFADNSSLIQNGTSTVSAHNLYGDLELSYEIDSLNLITGSVEFYTGNYGQDNNQFTSGYDSSHSLTQAYRLLTGASNDFGGLDASLNYQRGFKNDKNQLLTLSYKYSYSPNTQDINNSITDTFNVYLPDYKQNNHAGNREHTIQVDYVQPIKKINLEAGAKSILRNNFSNFETSNYDEITKDYEVNPSQTNDFKYDQNIYSVYNSYSAKWDKLNAKAGLRLEHTTVRADFTSTSTTVNQDYNNLIPSLSIQWNLKSSNISLGYTDRISRPGIYQLNPFVDLTNPNFINTGNPNLQPEVNHSFELNYSIFSKNSITAGLSYTFSNNSVQTVTHLQAVNSTGISDTVTVTTYAAAPYFYRGRRGRYAARLTRLALRARRHHVGLGVAARARPTTRTGASPPGRRGDVLEPSNRPLVAGRRPGAIAHRRLAEAERGLRPAGGGLILVVPERDPGGAHRYTALPTASARVAGPQLVHVRPRLLGRRVGQQRRSLELVAELPLVIPRVLDGLRVRHEGQDAVGVLPDRPVGARRDEVASLGHCVVCIDNSSYYDCSGAPPGLLIRGLAPNAVELPDPRASPAWLDAGASRPVQSLRKLRKGFIAIGANTP